eukprot:15228696-Alexandrium_andersonii.AAC.1
MAMMWSWRMSADVASPWACPKGVIRTTSLRSRDMLSGRSRPRTHSAGRGRGKPRGGAGPYAQRA